MEHNPTHLNRALLNRFEIPRDAECDALADLFLGSASPATPPPAANTNTLELVVALHLTDGRERFAAHCRRQAAINQLPIGCVEHVGAGWAADLVGPGSTPSRGRRATVGKAIAHIAAHAARVCVLLPAHDEVGSLIAGLSDLTQPADQITVLCSTDEGEIVASYRQIKSIAILCPKHISRLTLAVMGKDPERCRSTIDRIERTARQFLSLELRCTVLVEEEPVYTEQHFDPHDPAQVSIDAYAPVTPPPHQPAAPPIAPHVPAPAPAPAPYHNAYNRGAPTDRGLEALVGAVTALAVRCPSAPEVTIAVDAEGRLHVIAATFAGPGWNPSTDPVAALTLARAFAARHRGVLSALDPRVTPTAGAPEAHLVVNHFADAAPILESGLRLHLATIIEVDGLRRFGASPLA